MVREMSGSMAAITTIRPGPRGRAHDALDPQLAQDVREAVRRQRGAMTYQDIADAGASMERPPVAAPPR